MAQILAGTAVVSLFSRRNWFALLGLVVGFFGTGTGTGVVQAATGNFSVFSSLPFGRRIEFAPLDRALQTAPEKLIAFIESQGVKVYLYPSKQPANPQFRGAAKIPTAIRNERMLKSVFEDSGEGTTIPDSGFFSPERDEQLGRYGTFIAISESATSYTLLHEFTHFLFYQADDPAGHEQRYSIASRAFRSQRNLERQLEYTEEGVVDLDRYKRDGLVEALLADIAIERERALWVIAEEVLVEALLVRRMAVTSSKHSQAARQAKGAAYAADNIDKSRLELARRLHTWSEMKQIFMYDAGTIGRTSTAEREEIIESVPVYEATIFAAVAAVTQVVDELEAYAQVSFPSSR